MLETKCVIKEKRGDAFFKRVSDEGRMASIGIRGTGAKRKRGECTKAFALRWKNYSPCESIGELSQV
jgi:hypothetical protein